MGWEGKGKGQDDDSDDGPFPTLQQHHCISRYFDTRPSRAIWHLHILAYPQQRRFGWVCLFVCSIALGRKSERVGDMGIHWVGAYKTYGKGTLDGP